MLSNFSWNVISTIAKVGGALRLFPFELNSETRKLSVKPAKTYFFGLFTSQNLGFKIMSALVFGNFGFGAIRVLQSIFISQKSFQDAMFQTFVLIISFLGAAIQMNSFTCTTDFAAFITGFAQNEKRLTSKQLYLSFTYISYIL
jgi:hypothetical protein